jgi:hypothetical protein
VGPGDELVERFTDLILADGAVAVAMDVLLDQVPAEAGGFDLTAIEG